MLPLSPISYQYFSEVFYPVNICDIPLDFIEPLIDVLKTYFFKDDEEGFWNEIAYLKFKVCQELNLHFSPNPKKNTFRIKLRKQIAIYNKYLYHISE